MFAVPFEEIASITDRSPAAARQLASRARRRVQGQARVPDPDLARQWNVLDAFIAASREGDFDALVAVLDPDIVLREDDGTRRPPLAVVRGARAVAGRALTFSHMSPYARPALVNGATGVVVFPRARPSVRAHGLHCHRGQVVEINVINDPARLSEIDLSVID